MKRNEESLYLPLWSLRYQVKWRKQVGIKYVAVFYHLSKREKQYAYCFFNNTQCRICWTFYALSHIFTAHVLAPCSHCCSNQLCTAVACHKLHFPLKRVGHCWQPLWFISTLGSSRGVNTPRAILDQQGTRAQESWISTPILHVLSRQFRGTFYTVPQKVFGGLSPSYPL